MIAAVVVVVVGVVADRCSGEQLRCFGECAGERGGKVGAGAGVGAQGRVCRDPGAVFFPPHGRLTSSTVFLPTRNRLHVWNPRDRSR